MFDWLRNKKKTADEKVEIASVDESPKECDHTRLSLDNMKLLLTLPMRHDIFLRRGTEISSLCECTKCGKLLSGTKLSGVYPDTHLYHRELSDVDAEQYISQCTRMGIEKNALLIGRLQKIATRDTKIVDVMKDGNRINSLTDYAIKFDNGNGLCVVDNVLVPSRWIFEKDKLSASDFINAKNMEERKRFVKIIGGEDVLKKLLGDSAIEVNSFSLENSKVSLTTRTVDGIAVKMLKMQNTWDDSPYYLFVPPWIRTAKEGVAWSFYQDPSNYKPTVEA